MNETDIRIGQILEAVEFLKEHRQDTDQKFALISENLVKINQTLDRVVPEIDRLSILRQRFLGVFVAVSFISTLIWALWTELLSKIKVT